MLVALLTNALPIADEDEIKPKLTSNQLFRQLNEILKREITKETKEDSLEIGDKIKGDDGKLHINIQSFSSFSSFPLSFKPQDEEVLEDKEIITIVKDFEGSSEYEIKKESSDEITEKAPFVSTENPKSEWKTSTVKAETSSVKDSSLASAESSSTVKAPTKEKAKPSGESSLNKHEKLLKDIAEEPVILTHI